MSDPILFNFYLPCMKEVSELNNLNCTVIRMPIYKHFLYILVLFIPLHAQRENIRFRHLTIEDGLSQNTILCMVQDDMGFMWFGTKGGINKYDGYDFTVYKADIYDTTSLSENNILSICKDHNGILWIGTEDGLNRFDPARNTFTRYFHNPDDVFNFI